MSAPTLLDEWTTNAAFWWFALTAATTGGVVWLTVLFITVDLGGQLAARMTGAFTAATQYRVRYVNGAAAQATFRLSSSCVDS